MCVLDVPNAWQHICIAAEINVTSWREEQRIRQTDRHLRHTQRHENEEGADHFLRQCLARICKIPSHCLKIEISQLRGEEQENLTMEWKSVSPVGDGRIVRSGARTLLPWLSAAALLIGCIAVVTSSRLPISELGVSLCTGDQSCFCEKHTITALSALRIYLCNDVQASAPIR